jgi:SUKH-4 immunity protein
MQDQEIIEFWGRENLIRFSPAEVADLALSSRSKSFLCKVGLPSPKDDPLWKYSYHFQSGKLQRMPDRKSCLCIGVEPRRICIDEQRGGCVFMPSMEGDMERFVNSTVEQFGAFLAICWGHQKALLRADGNITLSRSIFTELKQKLQEVDPAALLDENAYWAVVLEDMWYPLMTDEELENLK